MIEKEYNGVHYNYQHLFRVRLFRKKMFYAKINYKKRDDYMKILIVSDSHMYNNNLKKIIEIYKSKVDLMIHCGDSSLPQNDPLINNFDIVVKGNHDEADYPLFVKKEHICVTHGHKYQVYKGYQDLIELCKTIDCQICLHGHTHVPTVQNINGITFINPGSLMMNRGSYGYGTYAILTIEDNNLHTTFYNIETLQKCDSYILKEGLELLEEFKKLVIK